jgi:hypothetical protein
LPLAAHHGSRCLIHGPRPQPTFHGMVPPALRASVIRLSSALVVVRQVHEDGNVLTFEIEFLR